MNASKMKYIAYGAMLCDHTAAFVLEPYLTGIGADASRDPLYNILRTLGRPALFLFAFFVAEGMRRTGSRVRYLTRLLLLALISEIPYDLCRAHRLCDNAHQSTILTLFLGGLLIAVWDLVGSLVKKSLPLQVAARAASIAAFGVLAVLLRTDYGFAGVYLILLFYLLYLRSDQYLLWIGALSMFFFFLTPYFGSMPICTAPFPEKGILLMLTEVSGLLALIPIERYNGEKGSMPGKLACYLFYPSHLILFYGLTLL